MKEKLDRKFGCFEIFGFDFMLDSDLNPFLLEVNINPAMFLDTPVLEEMLPKLINDTCKMAVKVHQPNEKCALKEQIETSLLKTKLKYQFLYSE